MALGFFAFDFVRPRHDWRTVATLSIWSASQLATGGLPVGPRGPAW